MDLTFVGVHKHIYTSRMQYPVYISITMDRSFNTILDKLNVCWILNQPISWFPKIFRNNDSNIFHSYLFTCWLNSSEANYKVSRNKRKKENKNTKHVNLYKTNSVALSPRSNYTDWATATCRRNLVPSFMDRGVSRGQRGGSPTVVNLSFLDRSRYFSFK
jgi:hypothetical protein